MPYDPYQAITEAYNAGRNGNPDWSSSKYFSGVQGVHELVSPEMRAFVNRAARTDLEIDSLRTKNNRAAVVDAVANGGLPNAVDGGGRGGGRANGGGRRGGRKGDRAAYVAQDAAGDNGG